MSFEIKQATRQGVKPLIGIFSESGCGKTMSSLLLARGFVGSTGKIVMLDTESGRGSLYADVIPGGYEVIEMREPFSPMRYIEAIQTVEKSGAAILIIDSGSHEWEGIGGVLDMATDNESRSGKPGLHNWKQPKMEHAKFMLKMLQSPLPIVVCLRAKYKTRQTKENGRTVIVKDEYTTPIQADQFIFEMTAHGEILQDHSLHLTKCSHPSLRDCFPEGKPITTQHGELLAAWCNSAGKPISQDKKTSSKEATEATRQWMLAQLKDLHVKMQAYAIDKGIIMPDQGLEDWPLVSVPTDKGQLAELRKKIENHA
jgi:hypothetical protein